MPDLDPTVTPTSVPHPRASTEDQTTTVVCTCVRCGLSFDASRRGRRPSYCLECRPLRQQELKQQRDEAMAAGTWQPQPERPAAHLTLALAVTEYRLAIEQATALLRMGRPTLALAVLEDVEAPARYLDIDSRRSA